MLLFKYSLDGACRKRKLKNGTLYKYFNSFIKKEIAVEIRKIENTISYVQQCASKEYEKNKNLLRFKCSSKIVEKDNKSMSNEKISNVEVNLQKLYSYLIRLSYLFNNVCVNEMEWPTFYLQVCDWNLLDVKQKKDENRKKKGLYEQWKIKQITSEIDKNVISMKTISNNMNSENVQQNVEWNIKNEYKLDSLYSCYLFIHNILVRQMQNYLQMYSTDNYLKILKGCEKIFQFFFQFHKKNLKKLSFIYIYATTSKYKENVKLLKNKRNLHVNTKNNTLHLNYYYDELYNYKFNQIFTSSLYLMKQVLDSLNFYTIKEETHPVLIDFFWRITMHGIILEESILKLLHFYLQKNEKHYLRKTDIFPFLHKIVSIMHFSKIFNYPLVILILHIATEAFLLCMKNIKEWFDFFLRLLKIVGLNKNTFLIYKYCKRYVLNNMINLESFKVFDFFYVSSLIGIYDISLIHFFTKIISKEKNQYQNATIKNKIYYTLLGWDVIFKKNIGNIRNETNVEIILINYYSTNTQYVHSVQPNTYTSCFLQMQFYLHIYRKELSKIMRKRKGANYLYNQYTILNILKNYYSDIKYEYITEHNLVLDIFLNNEKKKDSFQKVAIEFNGRTHYNLIDKSTKDYQNKDISLVENLNTVYKKWLLKNAQYVVISIPYFKWNQLCYQEKVKNLLQAINVGQ